MPIALQGFAHCCHLFRGYRFWGGPIRLRGFCSCPPVIRTIIFGDFIAVFPLWDTVALQVPGPTHDGSTYQKEKLIQVPKFKDYSLNDRKHHDCCAWTIIFSEQLETVNLKSCLASLAHFNKVQLGIIEGIRRH